MKAARQPSPPAFHVPESVHILIPYLIPPTVNHYKKPIRLPGGQTSYARTAEANAFIQAVCLFARSATIAPPTQKERHQVRYQLSARVTLGKGDKGDGDNFWKCLADGLVTAGVIHSDARVRVWHLEVNDEDRANPRTEVTASIWQRPE